MSDTIREIQEALVEAGYDIGETGVDGILGENTEKALALAGGLRALFTPEPEPEEEESEVPANSAGMPAVSDSPWLEVARVEMDRGVSEVTHPDTVVGYSMGETDSPETPWCAYFLNWVLAQLRIKGTGSGVAKKFERWGKKTEVRKGAIAVFENHVAIVSRITPNGRIFIIGGNQSNAVCEHPLVNLDGKVNYGEPISYRWPSDAVMNG